MKNGKEYASLVTQAEKAVSSVKDPELRRVAFEKILDDLLRGGKSLVDHDSKKSKSEPIHHDKSSRKSVKGGRKTGGPQKQVEELIEENFFKTPRTISNVKEELENRGHHIPLTHLSPALQRLCKKKLLRRQRTNAEGDRKNTFKYANW